MSISERIKPDVLNKLVSDVNARLTNRATNKVIGDSGGSKPRFELYHASLSLCSFKVRTTLAEKGLAYSSHALSIIPAGKAIPQNYRPEYVRLRLKGQEKPKFVSGYTGTTSVAEDGFDPCVVPTLVDHQQGRVVIDSKNVCEFLDEATDTGTDLIPDDLAEEVKRQLELVDKTPHVALLCGAHPEDDRRPQGLAVSVSSVHAKKVRALKAVLAHIGEGEPELRVAYESKIAMESAVGAFMMSDEQIIDAHNRTQSHVNDLEEQLRSHNGPWICGDRYTMADVFWTISLYRLKWLGNDVFWGPDTGNTRVAEYIGRAIERPSFRAAVREWKYSHGPSDYVEDTSGGAYKASFLLHALREMSLLEAIFGSDIPIPKQ